MEETVSDETIELPSINIFNEEAHSKDTDYVVHPVLKGLARLNGQINRMSIPELQDGLRSHNLDTRGKKDVLKKRLKSYYKRKQLSTANMRDPAGVNYYYKYMVIIDYEATCDVGQPNSYRQEIIEFPALLLKTNDREIVDEFHSYVRPVVNPRLTTFCTTLTGITQDTVNTAPYFLQVLNMFEQWLQEHNLSSKTNNFIVVSDGPWDMGRFLVQQCKISNISVPEWGKKWINIRKTYSNFYDTKRICLQEMLMRLGMCFEGQPHRGIDDARNIARITKMLLEDGANLRENEKLKEKSGSFTVVSISRKEFEDSHRRGGKTPRRDSRGNSQKRDCVDQQQILEEEENVLEASVNDYLLNLDPPIPSFNDSEFPVLGVQNRIAAMSVQ